MVDSKYLNRIVELYNMRNKSPITPAAMDAVIAWLSENEELTKKYEMRIFGGLNEGLTVEYLTPNLDVSIDWDNKGNMDATTSNIE
ncbi:MAG: hypothetical protein NTZ20_05320 [Candidatus Levybacteria bacterium]|nr:hypothetical protein [Candidatus Levybacteria bacterium]